jgi:holo-[acyl-carrier protein] synthase
VAEGIIGIGLDLVEVARIEESMEKFGDRFLKKIFCEAEREYACSHKFPAVHLAARFAAKEAVSKAFGTGIGRELGWLDIEVCRHPHGEPFLRFHGAGQELAIYRGVVRTLISLTHTRSQAAASVVLIGRDG